MADCRRIDRATGLLPTRPRGGFRLSLRDVEERPRVLGDNWSGSGRSRGDALQLPKRIKRSKRYEFEAHQVRPAERQLLEHVARGSRVGYVQEERDAASTLKRVPLIDLAIEIKLHRFADFVRQD